MPHRLGDEAAHAGDALVQHRTFGEPPAAPRKPRLQLGPDALVRPIGDVLVRRALEVEAADLRRAHAEQREAALVMSVDQLLRYGRRPRQDAEPRERVRALVERQHTVRNRRTADAVKAITAGDHVAGQLLRLAVLPIADLRLRSID